MTTPEVEDIISYTWTNSQGKKEFVISYIYSYDEDTEEYRLNDVYASEEMNNSWDTSLPVKHVSNLVILGKASSFTDAIEYIKTQYPEYLI